MEMESGGMTRAQVTAALSMAAMLASFHAIAQQPPIGVLQKCSDGQTSLKITQCSAGASAMCDVELYQNGKAQPAARLPANAVGELLRLCAGNGAAPPAASAAGAARTGPDANGFSIGDTVRAATAGGWYEARILKASGDRYLVSMSGIEVVKQYPQELRRSGPITAGDRARGLYDLHDRVQVNVEGKWVPGEVRTEMGMDYEVVIPGNRTVWANGQQMRYVGAPVKAAVPAAGQPPKPGLTSCAGRIEGRYSSPQVGAFTIVFYKTGKARLKMYNVDDETELECWISGRTITLHKPGTNEDMPIEINDDGTLDTPMGEVKKKGS